MKKVLNISIIAMLAVVPLTASADRIATAVAAAKATAPEEPDDSVATTSYVKGAYADIATEHNKVVTDITVSGVSGEGNHISNSASAAENIISLNLAIKDNDSALTLLNSADTEAGSVAYAVKNSAESAKFTPGTSGIVASTLSDAIKAVNSRVTEASSASTLDSAGEYYGANTAVTAAIPLIDAQVATNADGIATNADNIDAIGRKQIPVYGTWGSSEPTHTYTIDELTTAASVP